jgi:hypothetical protein
VRRYPALLLSKERELPPIIGAAAVPQAKNTTAGYLYPRSATRTPRTRRSVERGARAVV